MYLLVVAADNVLVTETPDSWPRSGLQPEDPQLPYSRFNTYLMTAQYTDGRSTMSLPIHFSITESPSALVASKGAPGGDCRLFGPPAWHRKGGVMEALHPTNNDSVHLQAHG